MSQLNCVTKADAPYPEIKIVSPNREYADIMLSNMAGMVSEMSAVSLYFYNSLITKNYNKDIAKCFEKISISEMHHLEMFGDLAVLLGADPRLWSRKRYAYQYWSPGYNRYPTEITELINNSIHAEMEAIEIYTEQANYIKDDYITDVIKRIILDEECHIQTFNAMLDMLK